MAKEFTVREIRELTRLSPEGDLEKVFRIEATTAKGTRFSLDLTEAQADPEVAQGILAARAKQLDGIKTL